MQAYISSVRIYRQIIVVHIQSDEMIKLDALSANHFDEVIQLICDRYSVLHSYAPKLPDKYMEYDVTVPLLRSTIDNAPGVVAYDDNHQLVGYISGWMLSDFRGTTAVLSPEWGNATRSENSTRIYEAMYDYIANEWVKQGFYTHIVCQYADQPQNIKTW